MIPTTEMLIWVMILVGVLTRMILPFLRKRSEARLDGGDLDFNMRYLYASVAALIIALITASIGFMAYPVPTDLSDFKFYMAAWIYGIGLDWMTIEGLEWLWPKPPS